MSTQNWTDALSHLKTLIDANNYKRLTSATLKILDNNGNDNTTPMPENVRFTLTSIYIKSLLKIGSFQTAHEYCTKPENRGHYTLEEAYALYRMKKYEECLKICQKASASSSNEGILHTHAQCLYRLHQTNTALDIYNQFIENSPQYEEQDQEQKEEIAANTLACLQSTHDKLLSHSSTHNLVQNYLPNLYQNSTNYDLACNFGTFLSMSSTHLSSAWKGEQMLLKALKECQYQLKEDGGTDSEIMEELLPIKANLAYALLKTGKHKEADEILDDVMGGVASLSINNDTNHTSHHHHALPPSVQSARASAANNIAVRRIGTESLFDSLKRLQSSSLMLLDNGVNASTETHDRNSNANNEKQQQLDLTPFMIRSLLYNKAILLLKMGKEDKCLEILQILTKGYLTSSSFSETSEEAGMDKNKKSNKKKQNKKKEKSKEMKWQEDNHLGIKMYAELMQVELLRGKGEIDEANAMLKQMKETYEGLLQTEVDLYHSQMKMLESSQNNNQNNDIIKSSLTLLQQFQETNPTLQDKPAIIATLIAMYNDLNKTKEASNLISSFSKQSLPGQVLPKTALGKYYLELGMYQQAKEVFDEILDSGDGNEDEKNECLALLVIALSYLDGEAAEEKLANLTASMDIEDDQEDNDEVTDGAELEQMDVPWISGGSSRRYLHTRGGEKGQKKKKKNQASILRYRAKKREAYLTKLTEEKKYNPDKPTQPDPERWIPKKQRSYHRRRKNRKYGAGTSHQGIATGMEDKKLDARARAAGEPGYGGASSSAPSTAHMSVSSGGGNFKKKKGKKR